MNSLIDGINKMTLNQSDSYKDTFVLVTGATIVTIIAIAIIRYQLNRQQPAPPHQTIAKPLIADSQVVTHTTSAAVTLPPSPSKPSELKGRNPIKSNAQTAFGKLMGTLRKRNSSKAIDPVRLQRVKKAINLTFTFNEKHHIFDKKGIFREAANQEKVTALFEMCTKPTFIEKSDEVLEAEAEVTIDHNIWICTLKKIFSADLPKLQLELDSFKETLSPEKISEYFDYLKTRGKSEEAEIVHNIFHLYNKVQQKREINSMDSKNLAIVFAPIFSELVYGQPTPATIQSSITLLSPLIEAPIFEKKR